MTLSQGGEEPVDVATVQLIAADDAFSLDSTCAPATISTAEPCVITVHLAPTVAAGARRAERSAVLEIEHDGEESPARLEVSAVVLTPGRLPTIPESLDLGDTVIGSAAETAITVVNLGGASARIQGASFAAGLRTQHFELTNDGCAGVQLETDATCSLSVLVTGAVAGTQSETVIVRSPDSHLEVPIEATVLRRPVLLPVVSGSVSGVDTEREPTAIDFGSVAVGQTRELTLTIRNDGESLLLINELKLKAPSDVFSIEGGDRRDARHRGGGAVRGNASLRRARLPGRHRELQLQLHGRAGPRRARRPGTHARGHKHRAVLRAAAGP